MAADLSSPEAAERLARWSADQSVDAVILNAATNYYGPALEQPLSSLQRLLATNVTALAELALRFGQHFAARPEGGRLMLVSSVASFSPVPYQATYAATKAFVTSLGLAIGQELRGSGVVITVFAPGFMPTPMLDRTELSANAKLSWLGRLSVERAARLGLRAMRRGAPLAVPGLMNKLIVFLARRSPLRMVLSFCERLYRQP